MAKRDEAHAPDGPAGDGLGPERLGELSGHHLGVDAVVDQQAPCDRAVDLTCEHSGPLLHGSGLAPPFANLAEDDLLGAHSGEELAYTQRQTVLD